MSRPVARHVWQPDPVPVPAPEPGAEPDLAALLTQVARGDHHAFELVYGELAGPVYEVADVVTTSLEHQRVRRCMDGLTGLQRESIKLAYYSGYSYPEVATLLGVALGTVKTRIRDGMIRIGITVEPAGGTKQPTTSPVAVLPT